LFQNRKAAVLKSKSDITRVRKTQKDGTQKETKKTQKDGTPLQYSLLICFSRASYLFCMNSAISFKIGVVHAGSWYHSSMALCRTEMYAGYLHQNELKSTLIK